MDPNMNLLDAATLVVDFEATGKDPKESQPIEVAAVGIVPGKASLRKFSSLIRPTVPIEPEASAVHHLIAEDLVNAPAWPEVMGQLDSLNPSDDDPEDRYDVRVSHYAEYDRGLYLANGGNPDLPWICTWRMAKKLLQDMPSYGNMALHYRLGLPGRPTESHRAMADALVTAGLYKHLLGIASAKAATPGVVPMAKFIAWLDAPIMQKKAGFGKHAGKLWTDVAKEDRKYIEWILDKSDMAQKDPDLKFTLETLLGRRG